MSIPVLVLFGQTATGKTELLSRLFSSNSSISLLAGCAEVVNADSVQVYRNTDVCSAMPSKEILKSLPHHLVSFKEPFDEFSVSDFVTSADAIIPNIYRRKLLPIVAGGAAFFISNFIYGLPITPTSQLKTRLLLQQRLKLEGITPLFEELKKIDPTTANRLHINDEYRILRALEVYYDSQRPLSSYSLHTKKRNEYNFIIVSLERKRENIYERIEKRTDEMGNSLRDEFIKLYENCEKQGVTPNLETVPLFKSIGYREFFELNNEEPTKAPFEKVISLIKRDTKHYAKRQETFFKRVQDVIKINMEESNYYEKLHNIIVDFYEDNF
ncbi:MAG: tRNA (adenosine(37)-N6)-dimethylallyltransferase MiaA [Treponema sp.]